MARKRYIPRSKRWRAERMRQGPGRGGKGDPTGTLDLLAQDLRTWLHKKKVERGRPLKVGASDAGGGRRAREPQEVLRPYVGDKERSRAPHLCCHKAQCASTKHH